MWRLLPTLWWTWLILHMLAHKIIFFLFCVPRVGLLLREMSAVAAGGRPCHLFYGGQDYHQNNVTYIFQNYFKFGDLNLSQTMHAEIKLNRLTVSSFLHPCIFFRWVCKKSSFYTYSLVMNFHLCEVIWHFLMATPSKDSLNLFDWKQKRDEIDFW